MAGAAKWPCSTKKLSKLSLETLPKFFNFQISDTQWLITFYNTWFICRFVGAFGDMFQNQRVSKQDLWGFFPVSNGWKWISLMISIVRYIHWGQLKAKVIVPVPINVSNPFEKITTSKSRTSPIQVHPLSWHKQFIWRPWISLFINSSANTYDKA